MEQMGKWTWQYTTTGLDNSTELPTEKIRQAVRNVGSASLAAARPAAWWRHQMETSSALLAILCGEFTSHHRKGQWRGALISTWINGWVNNREANDFRRHRAHYDVTVTARPANRPDRHDNTPPARKAKG